MFFPVICHYEDGGYWAEFPDLPGCFSQGETEQEVMKNSKESLSGYLITLLESGKEIPVASSISTVKLEGAGFVSLVEGELMGSNFSKILQDAILLNFGMV